MKVRSIPTSAWLLVFVVSAAALRAQYTLPVAVGLALQNSPRVKSAEADLRRSRASLGEAKDTFVPNINAGAGLGDSFGYSPYPPTLFNITSGSLVYNSSQLSYIKSAHAGVDAASDALSDMRETVAEDAALTFLALAHDQERIPVLHEDSDLANKLLRMVQDRFNAGQDSRMNLLDAQLTVANLKLNELRTEEDLRNDRAHLARLLGIPGDTLTAEGSLPEVPVALLAPQTTSGFSHPNRGIASAFDNARAKQLQAHGDARFLYRPNFQLFLQYNRYETFTDSWRNIVAQYGKVDVNGVRHLSPNQEAFAIQVSLPLLDRARRQRALGSAADASKALHDAEFAQINTLDFEGRLTHNLELLQAQAAIAQIEQQRAEQQLAIVQTRLSEIPDGPPANPKDEIFARIGERDKYIALLDIGFSLHQAQISLLRQTGNLEDWLAQAAASALPPGPQRQP